MEQTEVKPPKKQESRAIAHKVSNLIHQQAGMISQTIEDYTQRQNERQVQRIIQLPFIYDKTIFKNKRVKGMNEPIYKNAIRKHQTPWNAYAIR
jgi:hypothetical protein